MKTLISISIALLFCQNIKAQENSVKKYFLFVNPATNDQIKIQTGNRVAIRFKLSDIKLTGIILSLSDSSLTLGFDQHPYHQNIPFWNIAEMKRMIKGQKRYSVRVVLKNGKTMKGELVRTTRDSLSIIIWNYQRTALAGSEINSIRIRGRSGLGNAIKIGVAVGVIGGLIIGYESLPIPPHGCTDPVCIDQIGASIAGGAIGGAVGAAAGALIGLVSGKEFRIEGNQAQFDLFANEFMYK